MLHEISRRKFMELTGAGALLLASAGMMTGCCREDMAMFGQIIDMGDLWMRVERMSRILDGTDGVVFGCIIHVTAKDAAQELTLRKTDFSLQVFGLDPKEYNLRHNSDLEDIKEKFTFSGSTDFYLYGYFTLESLQDKISDILGGFEMKVTFRHNGRSINIITRDPKGIIGGS